VSFTGKFTIIFSSPNCEPVRLRYRKETKMDILVSVVGWKSLYRSLVPNTITSQNLDGNTPHRKYKHLRRIGMAEEWCRWAD
jgi:hypothetical protein